MKFFGAQDPPRVLRAGDRVVPAPGLGACAVGASPVQCPEELGGSLLPRGPQFWGGRGGEGNFTARRIKSFPTCISDNRASY